MGRFVNFYKPRIEDRWRAKALSKPDVFEEVVNGMSLTCIYTFY